MPVPHHGTKQIKGYNGMSTEPCLWLVAATTCSLKKFCRGRGLLPLDRKMVGTAWQLQVVSHVSLPCSFIVLRLSCLVEFSTRNHDPKWCYRLQPYECRDKSDRRRGPCADCDIRNCMPCQIGAGGGGGVGVREARGRGGFHVKRGFVANIPCSGSDLPRPVNLLYFIAHRHLLRRMVCIVCSGHSYRSQRVGCLLHASTSNAVA